MFDQSTEAQILGLKIKVLGRQVVPVIAVEVDHGGLPDGIRTALVACFLGKFTVCWSVFLGREPVHDLSFRTWVWSPGWHRRSWSTHLHCPNVQNIHRLWAFHTHSMGKDEVFLVLFSAIHAVSWVVLSMNAYTHYTMYGRVR